MNYDFSKFHPSCLNKVVVACFDGLHVVCYDCGVSANLEAISAKISPVDACRVAVEDRSVLGDQSTGVNKGASK